MKTFKSSRMVFVIFVYIFLKYSVCRSMLLRCNRLDTVSRFIGIPVILMYVVPLRLNFHICGERALKSHGGILRDIRRTSCMRKIILREASKSDIRRRRKWSDLYRTPCVDTSCIELDSFPLGSVSANVMRHQLRSYKRRMCENSDCNLASLIP